jgi:hypothetical protein
MHIYVVYTYIYTCMYKTTARKVYNIKYISVQQATDSFTNTKGNYKRQTHLQYMVQ